MPSKIKKILVLNGSPKGEHSSTLTATKVFVDGLAQETGACVEYIWINSLNIKPCLGCLSCWGKTPGECVIKNDDANMIKEKIMECDVFIESYPLYFFGMPGTMKVFTDRMMPFMSTYEGQKAPVDGASFHGHRFEMGDKKFIIIASCAYTAADNVFDSLVTQYDAICGKGHYTAILCPQLKTLIELKMEDRQERFLQKFYEAGVSFGKNGSLTDEEISNLKKPPFSEGAYKVLLNKFWEQERNDK